jgi:hypothetical protein
MKKEEELDFARATWTVNKPFHLARKIEKHWKNDYFYQTSLLQIANLRYRRGVIVKIPNFHVELFFYDLADVLSASVDETGKITIVLCKGVTLSSEEYKKAEEHIAQCYAMKATENEACMFFRDKIPDAIDGMTPCEALSELRKLKWGEEKPKPFKRGRFVSEESTNSDDTDDD